MELWKLSPCNPANIEASERARRQYRKDLAAVRAKLDAEEAMTGNVCCCPCHGICQRVAPPALPINPMPPGASAWYGEQVPKDTLAEGKTRKGGLGLRPETPRPAPPQGMRAKDGRPNENAIKRPDEPKRPGWRWPWER